MVNDINSHNFFYILVLPNIFLKRSFILNAINIMSYAISTLLAIINNPKWRVNDLHTIRCYEWSTSNNLKLAIEGARGVRMSTYATYKTVRHNVVIRPQSYLITFSPNIKIIRHLKYFFDLLNVFCHQYIFQKLPSNTKLTIQRAVNNYYELKKDIKIWLELLN